MSAVLGVQSFSHTKAFEDAGGDILPHHPAGKLAQGSQGLLHVGEDRIGGHSILEGLGGLGHRLPGLLSVGLPGRSGQRLTYQLDVAGVSVSPGAACDNRGVQEPSHVLMALGGTAAEDALSTLRFSFGSANRPGDGKEAAERLIKILEHQ